MIEILNVRATQNPNEFIINGLHTVDISVVSEWIQSGKEVMPALTAEEINAITLAEKWHSLEAQWSALTVTTLAGHTFAANKEAMRYIDLKANNMLDNVSFLWVEDWGVFNTNIIELKEALNLAADAHQALVQSIFGA